MKDYTEIERLRDEISQTVTRVFDVGYCQGFQDGKDAKQEEIGKRVNEEACKAYQKGLKDGNIDDGTFAQKVKEAYQNGLDESWECARKIALMDVSETEKVFGEVELLDILGVFDTPRAIAIIREYEGKQNTDWQDIPVDDMTEEQLRQVVKDLRKKLVDGGMK